MQRFGKFLVTMLLIFGAITPIVQAESAADQRFKKAMDEAAVVWRHGPEDIQLRDQAVLKLPEGFLFVPQPQAGKLMTAMGNLDIPDLIGIVMPENDAEDWFITVKYIDSGYISDEEAKEWDVDAFFQTLKKTEAEANKKRREKGFPQYELTGWAEEPWYDAAKRHLIWGTESLYKGDKDKTINYNTYVLGRQGYVFFTLVSDYAHIPADKLAAAKILGSTQFVSGKRYEDYNSITDTAAGFGLSTLVTGVAAAAVVKKVGLAALIAKFGKVIVGALVVAAAGVWKWLRRKKDQSESG